MLLPIALIGQQHTIVVLCFILRRASAPGVIDHHQLPVDLPHVELLGLAVVHQHQVIQLRWLVQVEGELFLFLILAFDVVGAATALVRAAGAALGVYGAGVSL